MPEDVAWIQPLLLMIALGVVIMMTLKQARELKKLQEGASAKEKVLTLIECGGGQKREREFREGDYIGKRVNECGEGEGLIVGIYAVKEEQRKQSKGKQGKA